MQVIAMHGWGGDSRGWAPLQQACQARGWDLVCGERGYGSLPPVVPSWSPSKAPSLETCPKKHPSEHQVVIAHSLGPHLLQPEVLEQADAVVLLASFGRFIPEGRAGRRLRSALLAMAEQLQSPQAEAMLTAFLTKAAAPADPCLLPAGPCQQGLGEDGKVRLFADLTTLSQTADLPPGFPPQARVLLVEAGADQIVDPEATRALAASLPQADRLQFRGAGHCLLGTAAIPMVVAWLEALEWPAKP